MLRGTMHLTASVTREHKRVNYGVRLPFTYFFRETSSCLIATLSFTITEDR